jgi:multimeric flavodoxin WrbA
MVTEDFKDKNDYKRINLISLDIKHCVGCNKCNTGEYNCIFNDDMVEVYKSIEEADVVILATPIHFNSMTSVMKTMVDRCQRFFNMKVNNDCVFKKKIGMVIATAGSKNKKTFECLENISSYFFLSINAELMKKLLVNDTDNIKNNKFDLNSVYDMKKYLYTLYKDK